MAHSYVDQSHVVDDGSLLLADDQLQQRSKALVDDAMQGMEQLQISKPASSSAAGAASTLPPPSVRTATDATNITKVLKRRKGVGAKGVLAEVAPTSPRPPDK